MIDRATVNLYSCCKCNHKWLADWDTDNNRERTVPTYCPKCKNVRWNQKYTKEEDLLFDKIFERAYGKASIRARRIPKVDRSND